MATLFHKRPNCHNLISFFLLIDSSSFVYFVVSMTHYCHKQLYRLVGALAWQFVMQATQYWHNRIDLV